MIELLRPAAKVNDTLQRRDKRLEGDPGDDVLHFRAGEEDVDLVLVVWVCVCVCGCVSE